MREMREIYTSVLFTYFSTRDPQLRDNNERMKPRYYGLPLRERGNFGCRWDSGNFSQACCHKIAPVSVHGYYPVLAGNSVLSTASENTKRLGIKYSSNGG